ncbi:hypothetical protein GGR53DRAFT_467313 [Hypoxylon sp. FL1150]|nr:hypothetical protein GGR53DRAFT_467313 [Hypoxylon sp. FL1150]
MSNTKTRQGRCEKYLAIPDLYSGRGQLRCPQCTWTLLTKPWCSSNVPIISVTDPDGVVRYPYDHTYYFDESEENGGSDTDG